MPGGTGAEVDVGEGGGTKLPVCGRGVRARRGGGDNEAGGILSDGGEIVVGCGGNGGVGREDNGLDGDQG